MSLFTSSQMAKFQAVAEKSKQLAPEKPKAVRSSTISGELKSMSQAVQEYFADSKAILIKTKADLHDYITNCIDSGYAGIDTETTGLDRLKDFIVGASLYYPGGVECYIPMKHITPIFDSLYKDQLTYEEVQQEFQRLADSNIKLIFANADFDLAMIYKDLKVDLNERCYYDVILAWRCLKENELHNDLKSLYNKYVMRGKGDPKKFSDFFSVALFPYCNPEIAKLYAANDAKITYELFKWQLPYLTPSHPKCQRAHLEGIARMVWDVEFPLIKVCQNMHRTGIYLEHDISSVVQKRYSERRKIEMDKLQEMVQGILDDTTILSSAKQPFRSGKEFNPNSTVHVKYLLQDVMKVLQGSKVSTGKEVLHELNLPVTNQILVVRSYDTLIGTFVDKMPNTTWPDSRIHCQMKQLGADTGRMSSASPNMQNIPSHATDIRHFFRATPESTTTIQVQTDEDDNTFEFTLNELQKLNVKSKGWMCSKDIQVDDIFFSEDNEQIKVTHTSTVDNTNIKLECELVLGN